MNYSKLEKAYYGQNISWRTKKTKVPLKKLRLKQNFAVSDRLFNEKLLMYVDKSVYTGGIDAVVANTIIKFKEYTWMVTEKLSELAKK